MNSLFETLPQLAAYKPALIVLACLCLIVLVQNFLTAPLAFIKEEQVPGVPLKGDHSWLSFRVLRTHANSTESLPPFGFALLVAILAGVSAATVNWIAAIFLAARLAFWAIYYSGKGKIAGGPRTMSFIVGLLANIALVILSLIALL